MTKQDFEKLIGKEITTDHWKTVNFCYVACVHLFHNDEQSLVDYYNRNGLEGFYQLREGYINGKEISPATKIVNEWIKSLEDESGTCQSVDVDMTKEHLEHLFDCTLTDNEYFSIKECYSCYSSEHDLFESEDDFVLFFNTFGMDGIRKLNCHSAGEKAVEVRLCEEARAEHQKYLQVCIKNTQLSSYISAFLQALVKFFNEVLNDPLFSFDYSKSVFHALIDYLNKEIKRFESEVK